MVYSLFEVVAGRSGAKNHRTRIDLNASLELFDSFGRIADADQQQSAGQWVERAGVSDFEFLKVESTLDEPFQLVDNLKGSPSDGLVDGDNEACFLSHQMM